MLLDQTPLRRFVVVLLYDHQLYTTNCTTSIVVHCTKIHNVMTTFSHSQLALNHLNHVTNYLIMLRRDLFASLQY